MSGDALHHEAWVFHAGALGDFVMVWPLIRSLAAGGHVVYVVADIEKSRLAAREIRVAPPGGVAAMGSHWRPFARLWSDKPVTPDEQHFGAALVVNFVADPETAAGAVWIRNAGTMFPNARRIDLGKPGSAGRAAYWRTLLENPNAHPTPRHNPGGPVVMHVGAGSESKRWPLSRWAELREALGPQNTVCIAGEVEAERFSDAERVLFGEIGGRVCTSLAELADVIRGARVFVGADTGPTHLAAQMGIPTVALFGPTDPAIWKPVGPRVAVVAPGCPAAMGWLGVEEVRRVYSKLQAGGEIG